jgi:hypothetical protein
MDNETKERKDIAIKGAISYWEDKYKGVIFWWDKKNYTKKNAKKI